MKIVRNKIILSFEEKRKLRKLFWQKKGMKQIYCEMRLTSSVIRRIAKENRWYKKRERYWVYLIKKAYRNGTSIKKIGKRADIKYSILQRRKQRNKIKTQMFSPHNKRVTEEIEKAMIQDYKKIISSKKIANKYGFKTSKTVIDILEKHGVNRRESKPITYYNTDYFEKINSHDKAYILGLLLTDGYVIKDYMGFGIQLKEEDGYILEKISHRIGKSATVIHIDCEGKRKKARENGLKNFVNAQDMKRLTAHNRKIAEDLKKLGMVRNKTYILRCPFIYKKYLSSFFRGLWDGDGTIGIAKTKNIWCKIISASKLFIEDLFKIDIPFNFVIKTHSKACPHLYKLRLIGGNKETIKFLKWIYKYKGDLYLRRKYAKVQNKIN